MVVESDDVPWRKATLAPFGIAPLSANGLPLAGLSPTPPDSDQPVMTPPFPELYPGKTV